MAPIPLCKALSLRSGRLGSEDGLGVNERLVGLKGTGGTFRRGVGELDPRHPFNWLGRLCDLLDRRDRFAFCGLSGRFWASKVGVEGNADEGVKADSEALAACFSVGFKGGRKSEIEGHGVIMAPSWPRVVIFPPVLQDGGGKGPRGIADGCCSSALTPGSCFNDG